MHMKDCVIVYLGLRRACGDEDTGRGRHVASRAPGAAAAAWCITGGRGCSQPGLLDCPNKAPTHSACPRRSISGAKPTHKQTRIRSGGLVSLPVGTS